MTACPSFAQDAISFQRDIFLNVTTCILEGKKEKKKTNGREHKLGALDIKLPKKLVTF